MMEGQLLPDAMWAVITGHVIPGFKVVATFRTDEEAMNYANDLRNAFPAPHKTYCWVVEVPLRYFS